MFTPLQTLQVLQRKQSFEQQSQCRWKACGEQGSPVILCALLVAEPQALPKRRYGMKQSRRHERTRARRVKFSMILLRGRCLTGLNPNTPAAMSIAADVNTGWAQSATSTLSQVSHTLCMQAYEKLSTAGSLSCGNAVKMIERQTQNMYMLQTSVQIGRCTKMLNVWQLQQALRKCELWCELWHELTEGMWHCYRSAAHTVQRPAAVFQSHVEAA